MHRMCPFRPSRCVRSAPSDSGSDDGQRVSSRVRSGHRWHAADCTVQLQRCDWPGHGGEEQEQEQEQKQKQEQQEEEQEQEQRAEEAEEAEEAEVVVEAEEAERWCTRCCVCWGRWGDRRSGPGSRTAVKGSERR